MEIAYPTNMSNTVIDLSPVTGGSIILLTGSAVARLNAPGLRINAPNYTPTAGVYIVATDDRINPSNPAVLSIPNSSINCPNAGALVYVGSNNKGNLLGMNLYASAASGTIPTANFAINYNKTTLPAQLDAVYYIEVFFSSSSTVVLTTPTVTSPGVATINQFYQPGTFFSGAANYCFNTSSTGGTFVLTNPSTPSNTLFYGTYQPISSSLSGVV
jgi:hypothetical protein